MLARGSGRVGALTGRGARAGMWTPRGKKFDNRVYMLIPSIHPLTAPPPHPSLPY